MSIDFLCIGHASYDLSVFVDQFPVENSKCETRELAEAGGGPAANAAYLISKWGGGCAFAGLVGDDRYGRQIQAEFEAAGADASRLELRPGHPTPVSVILVNKLNGSRTIVNRKTNAGSLKIDLYRLAGIAPRVLLFDGHELAGSLAALEAFPEAISILDAGSWRPGTANLARRVDYLAASERFARQATGMGDLGHDHSRRECIRLLRERYQTTVIVTLGEQGLIADDGGGFLHLAAYPAEAVDTTAAGDIFHGALTWMVAQDASFLDALEFASMAASLSVRVAGGRASIPTLDAVKEALNHAG